MTADENVLLAQFHHTISEQLNARLSESPKVFALLVIISTGYGYVLLKPGPYEFFVPASLLAYGAVLWASWYLAALGYAFRFLQNSQHMIEHALGWNPRYVPGPEDGRTTGVPPPPSKRPSDWFWLLPSIYHPHAVGLAFFLVLVCVAFCWHRWNYWSHGWLIMIGLAGMVVGIGLIVWMNLHYLNKFRQKWREP